MAMPRKLKYMNMFIDGNNYRGQVTEVTQPKLAIKSEEYRSGGMIGAVDVDLGLEKLEAEIKMGGYMTELFRQFGKNISDVQLRFTGAYQQDDSGEVTPIEIVMRGRFTEIDPGNSKTGDDTEQTFKASLTYYKLIENSRDVVEIDMLNMIYIVDGDDKLADHRAAIGI